MIYFCADDYGLCHSASTHILECVDKGALNKVSVFPNFDRVNLQKLSENKSLRLSLHLNLVEGKCMARADEISLIADKGGNLKHTFGGLFTLSLLQPKGLEAQVYKEIKAQVSFWKGILPKDVPFCIDSHQHTHMIPTVFNALLKVLKDENIPLTYMRIPTEPILPYIQTPSLYFTYKPVNLVKQWLLNLLWLINKREARENQIPTSYFLGILFSGEMDEKRVNKLLPKYKKLAERDGKDIEVLFHPGYTNGTVSDFTDKNVVFNKFYLSPNRKAEFDSVIKITERSVL